MPSNEMHKAVEFLVGNPVFTHQFADRAFAKELSEAIWKQHPALKDFDAESVTRENWMPTLQAAIAKYGPTPVAASDG